jgi:hypothetical protein
MTTFSDLFWQAPLHDMKKGYIYQTESDEFVCLICGKRFANGLVYADGDQLYEAKKYVTLHITRAHQSMFHFLLNLDKKITGLTDHQKSILELFYAGASDQEAAKALNMGSASTIRNHRFSLRERQKQAKVFLAVMELLGEHTPSKQTFVAIPASAKQVDERFAITEQENEKILAAHFKQGLSGPLDSYPLKEKKRVAIIRHLVTLFDANKTYTEKEVNAILKPIYEDYVLLRRHLIDYGFMDRTQDGSSYWVKV